MSRRSLYNDITKRLLQSCHERGLTMDNEFAYNLVCLFAQDSRLGLMTNDLNNISACKINSLIKGILNAYTDPTNTTMINIKMVFNLKQSKEIELNYVKEKYDGEFQQKLKVIIDDILRYPETCNKEQLDDLFVKMQVFIIAGYCLGSPTNHVLLKLVSKALNSVIGRSDLQNYVLKKKYHREEYLKRLASTVAGIIIFNNDGPQGDRENVHDVPTDLKMAIVNTQTALATSLKRASNKKVQLQNFIITNISINIDDLTISYKSPIEKIHQVNQYVVSLSLLERSLLIIQEKIQKTAYLISVDKKRYDCVIEKIHDTLKMRTAIDSELVFPHFVYLAHVWTTMLGYFYHLVELNRLHEKLTQPIFTTNMEHDCDDIIKGLKKGQKVHRIPTKKDFSERFQVVNAVPGSGNFQKLKDAKIDEYCALTMTLTKGLLAPASVVRELCSNINIKFGFAENKYAKYCERYIEDFVKPLYNTIFSNVNLVLLFRLEEEFILNKSNEDDKHLVKSKDFEMQTEMLVENNLSPSNWMNVTWNVWDYHREAIHLANIRKCQSHDTQTIISYGQRNAQNQAYNTRKHL